MPNIADLSPSDISVQPPNVQSDQSVDSSQPVAGNVFDLGAQDIQTQDQVDAQKYGTPGQQALTVAEGLGEGFVGPVKTAVEAGLTKLGVPGLTPRDQALRSQTNPGEHFGSELTGFGAGAFTGTGEAALLGKAGEAAAALSGLQEAGTLGKIAATGIKGGAELSALQAGDEVSKAINQDPNQTLGSAAINIGLSGIIGGAGGAVLGSVSPFFQKSSNKLGIDKLANDFMGETRFLQDKPDLASGAAQEVGGRLEEADQILNGGLKGQAIEKALPQPTPENLVKIDQHLQEISDEAEKRIEQAQGNAYLKNVAPKLQQDLNDFQSIITSPDATISDKWNALDDLKRASQGHADYNVVTGGAEEKAVSKWIKPFNADLRLAAENPKVWGDAGNIQRVVNSAASDLYKAQKDFLPKITSKELGERVADPTKLQTLINQAEKGKTGLRTNAVRNYLDATQKAADAINSAHFDSGLEAPLSSKLNPTPILDHVLNTEVTPGRALAQWANRKGAATLANAAGDTAAGTVGGLAGSVVGHPLLGAWAGEKVLSPIFSVLAKPFAEQAVNSDAMKASVDYLGNAIKGEQLLNSSIGNLFRSGEVIPKNLLPNAASREKLQKSLDHMDQNPENAFQVAGNIGHYLPQHATAAATIAAQSAQYLSQLKPKPAPQNPFDKAPPVDKSAQNNYNRALDIAQQPLVALKLAKEGKLLPQDVQSLNTMYPGLHSAMVSKISDQLIEAKSENKEIPYAQRVSLSLLLGAPLDGTMTPQSMQSIMKANAGAQAPQSQQQGHAKSATGNALKQINKVDALYQTPLEARAINRKA